jgi:tetracycline repressor-like protein
LRRSSPPDLGVINRAEVLLGRAPIATTELYAAAHLAGLAFARYQLKIEPIASTDVEALVAGASVGG